MSLGPGPVERLARARADLRLGLPVVVAGDGQAMLAVAAEVADDARLADLRALGPVTLALTRWRAETLRIPAYDGDLVRLSLAPDTDAAQVRAFSDPARDLDHPLKGPLRPDRDGNADLYRIGLAVTKSAHLLPAILGVPVADAVALALREGLTLLDSAEIGPHLRETAALAPVASARLPMAAAGAGRVHVFRPEDGGEEHYAIEIGQPARDAPVLARVHSACFTGDVLGSLKCDCGAQLRAALSAMGAEVAGVLLYLNQEGRGIGLANKMRAYALQDQGFDTVEANHRLGFEDDERDFRLGAAILRKMGFAAVRLMTNNPAKIAMMEQQGIRVTERVPLRVGETRENAAYLATKRAKSGHLP